MAMNKDLLGLDLYNIRQMFSNKTMDELIDEYGTLENIRIEACKKEAEVIINHLKNSVVVSVNVNVTTTGTASNHTGTGTGTGTIQ